MPKTYTPKQVITKFQKLGFVEDRQSGSHKIFYHPETKTRAVIPYHLKELPKGTFKAILRESKISQEEFESA
ncbi:type II toxin-antitoxin system HicA family toxin [Candidatus Daviesbacteria bacterium]|nr:type II toxin-antitoxin system HicA family toxin [Candidatus Daviesbacteria bacterium]